MEYLRAACGPIWLQVVAAMERWKVALGCNIEGIELE